MTDTCADDVGRDVSVTRAKPLCAEEMGRRSRERRIERAKGVRAIVAEQSQNFARPRSAICRRRFGRCLRSDGVHLL